MLDSANTGLLGFARPFFGARSPAPANPVAARDGRGARRWLRRVSPVLFICILVAALVPGVLTRIELDYFPTSDFAQWYGTLKTDYAWLQRLADLDPKKQKYGDAYWLGWAGFVLMLPLLFYPFRKRFAALHSWGRLAGWLRIHTVLGALGPVLILYHSNFRFGTLTSAVAINSWFALWSMLAVIATGLIGRYFFLPLNERFHKHKTRSESVGRAYDDLKAAYERLYSGDRQIEHLIQDLREFHFRAFAPRRGPVPILGHTPFLGARHKRARRRFLKRSFASIDRLARAGRIPREHTDQWERYIRDLNNRYFESVCSVAREAAMERSRAFRLSAYWNHLHLPLSIILLLATLAHIAVTI